MPKRKKTKKEKLVADVRRETNPIPVFSVPDIIVPQAEKIATTKYHYISKDLLKTGIFTGVIIAAEFGYYFFSKGV